MSYNTDRRKPLVGRAQEDFLVAHDRHLPLVQRADCSGLHQWDDDHLVPKELMPPGSDWNALSNRAPSTGTRATRRRRQAMLKQPKEQPYQAAPRAEGKGVKKPAKPIPSRPFSKGHRPPRSANNLRRKSRG